MSYYKRIDYDFKKATDSAMINLRILGIRGIKRGCGNVFSDGGLHIYSCSKPAINTDTLETLYIHGDNPDSDNQIMAIPPAKWARIRELLNKFNTVHAPPTPAEFLKVAPVGTFLKPISPDKNRFGMVIATDKAKKIVFDNGDMWSQRSASELPDDFLLCYDFSDYSFESAQESGNEANRSCETCASYSACRAIGHTSSHVQECYGEAWGKCHGFIIPEYLVDRIEWNHWSPIPRRTQR